MKPPKCPLCNELHWAHEEHKFVKDKKAPVKDKPVLNKPVLNKFKPVLNAADARDLHASVAGLPSSRSTKWQQDNRLAYNAYMKDYMRKRRAK